MKRLLGSVILLCVAGFVSAQTMNELEQQRMNIIHQIEETSKILGKTTKEKQTTLTDLKAIDRQMEKRKDLIVNFNQEILKAESDIKEIQHKTESLEKSMEQLQEKYRDLLQALYRSKKTENKWVKILSANGLNDAFKKWRYVKQFENYVLAQLDNVNSKQRILNSKKQEIQEVREGKARFLEDERSHQEILEQEKRTKAKILNNLKGDENELKATLSKQRKNRERLNSEIERIILLEFERSKREKEEEPAAEIEKIETLSRNFSDNRGKLPSPMAKGFVSSKFGRQAHPTLKGIYIANNGIDLTSGTNKNVTAVFEGDVVGVETLSGYGVMVIIQHGEFYTVYSKLSAVNVQKGDAVKTGDSIGEALSHDNGYQLHFEIWKNKTKQNPQHWIKL